MSSTRGGIAIDRGLRLTALALLVSLAVTAWHDVSKAWDVWYYHLPFAARLVGLVDRDSVAFGRTNQARFDGFPLFGEILQGLAWRLTGRPECANLVAWMAAPGLAALLRRLFGVPPHVAFLALLAIPLVQIHATACYVDLPANALLTSAILIAFRSVAAGEALSLKELAGACVAAAASANMKFQLVPVVLVTMATLLACAPRSGRDKHRAPWAFRILGTAMLVIFARPLANLWRFGNPVWPVELHLLGHSFPFAEGAYASSPPWLERVPSALRWAASVFEFGLKPVASHARWSIDQWTPASDPGYRMGGFFGAYVALNVASLMGALVWVRHSRTTRAALGFMAGATLTAAMLPQSHELRYYLFWMLLLVSLNLIVWSHPGPARRISSATEHRDAEVTHDVRVTNVLGLVACAALGTVAWSTQGVYLVPTGDSFQTLVNAHVSDAENRALGGLPPGARVCVTNQPWTFLYAATFHKGARYRLQEAQSRDECDGAPLLERRPGL